MSQQTTDSVLNVSIDDGIALLEMSPAVGRSVNLVDEGLLTALSGALDALEADDGVRGAVLTSRVAGTFLAGGDVAAFLAYESTSEVVAAIEVGNAVLKRLETWRKPLVAAVDGACLGGGTELVLAAAAVVASDSPHTRFGLPEVKLGLLPGLGGCVRFPQRVGLMTALDVIVTGRNVYPGEASALGLVEHVVPADELLSAARSVVERLSRSGRSVNGRRGVRWSRARRRPARVTAQELLRTPLVVDYLLRSARARAVAATHGNYPAPPRIVDVLGVWARRGSAAGEAASAKAFAELLFTPEAGALIRLFLAQAAARRNRWVKTARPVSDVAVIGAGLMGTGIAEVSATAGLNVLLKDVSPDVARTGRVTVAAALAAKAGKGLTQAQADAATERVHVVETYEELGGAQVTIEAALEDVGLKRAILAEVEAVTEPGHLYASNTSAIRIEELAAGAVRPEAVVGMHYFSPVQKMPLLEVVVTRHTEEWAVATATEVGLKQGKSVIVVMDGPGFYTTRVLSMYLAEAVVALREGVNALQLERAMVKAGFPLGPLALMDDVGIDTGAKIEAVLEPLLRQRGYASGATVGAAGGVSGGRAGEVAVRQGGDEVGVSRRLAAAGFLGRKANKGFYVYEGGKREREFDVRAFLAAGLPLPLDGKPAEGSGGPRDALAERLLLTFAREAVVCLEEGVLRSARDGDVGAVLGLGFPPHLGGPFAMLDRMGPGAAVERFEALGAVHGERLLPPRSLLDMAASGLRFYPDGRH